jgi:uncharacterized protein (TIGR03118 family)
MNSTRTLACLLTGLLALSACGGGGDSSMPATASSNPLPSAGSGSGAPALPPALASRFTMRALVGDQGAPNIDRNLINGWGVAFNPTGFVWVANEGSSMSTLYDGNGVPNSLIVAIPAPAGAPAAHPTGIVFNGTQDFRIGPAGATAASPFIFATLTGTLAAWSPTINRTNALTAYDGSGEGRAFTALAIASNNGASMLYATDFAHGTVEMFDANFKRVTTVGSFVDNNLPSNYLPFGIQAIGGHIYVAYAQRDAANGEEMPGAGLGLIDEFDAAGVLVRRVATGGALNAPWGMALAPQGFGALSGALLVGNFGDGRINAYDASTGAFLGPVSDANGNAIVIPGLWGIAFGNGVNGQPVNTLFFAAGPDDEAHGVYGRIDLVP